MGLVEAVIYVSTERCASASHHGHPRARVRAPARACSVPMRCMRHAIAVFSHSCYTLVDARTCCYSQAELFSDDSTTEFQCLLCLLHLP